MCSPGFALSAVGDEIADDLHEQLCVLRELNVGYLDLRNVQIAGAEAFDAAASGTTRHPAGRQAWRAAGVLRDRNDQQAGRDRAARRRAEADVLVDCSPDGSIDCVSWAQ